MNTLIQESLGDAIVDALRSLMFQLCDTVYRLISFAFRTFEALGTATILKDQDLARIFERVGLILGLFMLFRVTFAMIQYIVDPDKMTDKTKGLGNIVKKIVIAIVLLGSTSTIFKMAFKVQEVLIDNHVISNLIFGPNAVDLTDDNYYGGAESSNFGGHFSAELFSAFYRPNEKIDRKSNEFNNSDKLEACYFWMSKQTDNETGNVSSPMSRQIATHGGALTDYDSYAAYCLEEKGMINKDLIDADDEESKNSVKEYGYIAEFDGSGFIALAVGVFALYTIIVFTIQVGIRVIQLAYLQIIAPIPIMMYITPKGDEQLKKWVSQCTTTFLDFFLRTAIIYFAVFAIQSLWSSDTIANILTAGNISQSGWQKAYVMVVMVLAILLFAKKVPNLLKEIFPSLGGAAGFDYGMDIKKTVNGTLAPALLGTAAGAVGGLASNAIHGYMNARKDFREKGKKAGFKSIGKGLLSTVGGAFGGAKAGLGTKDITKMGNAVKVANANREKRELMAKAGYRWYNSVPKRIGDSVLSFAGETSGAEAKLKTAQFRQEALQQSKSLAWQQFYEANPNADLGLLRSIQEFEEKGKKVYKGIDRNGDELTFTKNAAGEYINTDAGGINITGDEAKAVNESLRKDKDIKEQGKIIKGLQTADEKSKK